MAQGWCRATGLLARKVVAFLLTRQLLKACTAALILLQCPADLAIRRSLMLSPFPSP